MTLSKARDPWDEALRSSIDEAVLREARCIKTAARFLPLNRPAPEARTVPEEAILHGGESFFIDEAAVTPLVEIWVEFTLTRQQVHREAELGTGRALAVRAANLLAQAEDAVVFQGESAFTDERFFTDGRVSHRRGASPLAAGLLTASVPPARRIEVPALTADPPKFGENTFEAVAQGYRALQDLDHEGPYALVLPPAPFADTQAALPETLLRPAERIEALLRTDIHDTGNLPPTSGLLVSLGASTMDLVLGQEPEVAFLFEDDEGKFRFRVWERFTLRLRDESAVVRLDFITK